MLTNLNQITQTDSNFYEAMKNGYLSTGELNLELANELLTSENEAFETTELFLK